MEENNREFNEGLIILTEENKVDLFKNMRELAYAQLHANYMLGVDAHPADKDDFVKNFNYEEIDPEDFNDITPDKVFEQYVDMFKEKELVDGYPAIKEVGLFEAVNKLIYYGFMKTYSRLHDEGLVDMYCLPDGEVCFTQKGRKPSVGLVQAHSVDDLKPGNDEKNQYSNTFRVKITKKSPKKKNPTSKKPTNKKKKKK